MTKTRNLVSMIDRRVVVGTGGPVVLPGVRRVPRDDLPIHRVASDTDTMSQASSTAN